MTAATAVGRANLALVVSAISAFVAIAGVAWQLTLYRLSGPRLQVRLRPALLSEDGGIIRGPDSGWAASPPDLIMRRLGQLPVELAEVSVVNIGRSPVRVQDIGLDLGGWKRFGRDRRTAVGIPVAIEGASAETDVRLEAGDAVNVFIDVLPIIESVRRARPRDLVIRGRAVPAGRRSTRSAWRRRWRVVPSQMVGCPYFPLTTELRVYRALWRSLRRDDENAPKTMAAWVRLRPLLSGSSPDLAVVIEALDDLLLRGAAALVAFEVVTEWMEAALAGEAGEPAPATSKWDSNGADAG